MSWSEAVIKRKSKGILVAYGKVFILFRSAVAMSWLVEFLVVDVICILDAHRKTGWLKGFLGETGVHLADACCKWEGHFAE